MKHISINESFLTSNDLVKYFKDTDEIITVIPEDLKSFSVIGEIINQSFPRPNLYAIYIRKKDSSQWVLKYIGQRKSKGIKQRLREHLIKKHAKTGSKLELVKKELEAGSDIGIKLAIIIPEELRLYYENKLIVALNPIWNIHR